MFNKPLFLFAAITLILSLLLSGCSGPKSGGNPIPSGTKTQSASITPAPPRGVTGTITTGKTVTAASSSVSPAGGSISVTETGTPITGLEINVSANSYAEAKKFQISYSPIEKHSFGDAFHPITPMITIENGGQFSEKLMTLKIPVKVPENRFAMGFIYDDKTGKLSGLPVVAQDADFITVATRHFCSLLISDIEKARLNKDIDTGFRPGVNDWEFPNWGSYIAPSGHCAGQSLAALWYYVIQPEGQGVNLYGRFDNWGNQPATPKLWEDDSHAYRFVSSVHADINWHSDFNEFWTAMAGLNDTATWYMFAYSMQMTGEPQECGIYSKAGGGHDMICYGIYQGNLYIADPNYPGDTQRVIEWSNGQFKPYNSGENVDEIAKGNGKNYEIIQYCTKSTTVDWNKISQRWSEFMNGTAGNDRFPDYKIIWTDDKNVNHELQDGFISSKDLININATSTQAQATIQTYRDGVKLPWDAKGNYKLLPGNNKLGIKIFGKINNSDEYVDFKYINVIYSGLAIDPPALEGEPGKDYTFKAVFDKLPAGVTFKWLINDTSRQNTTASSFTTSFGTEGNYNIKLSILDSSGKEIQAAQATAKIQKTSPYDTGRASLKWAATDYPPGMELSYKSESDQGSANSANYNFKKQLVKKYNGNDLKYDSKMQIYSQQYFITDDLLNTKFEDGWKSLLNSVTGAEQVIIQGSGNVRQALLIKHNNTASYVTAVAEYRYKNIIISYQGSVTFFQYLVNGVSSSDLKESDLLPIFKDEANAELSWVTVFLDKKFAAFK
jgi:hypothetical protein